MLRSRCAATRRILSRKLAGRKRIVAFPIEERFRAGHWKLFAFASRPGRGEHTMAKLSLVEATQTATELPIGAQIPVGNAGTRTTPDNEKAGTLEGPNVVTSLLLYDTDLISLLPKTVKRITVGSDPGQNIVIASPFVSKQHCRIDRSRNLLRVKDLKSKNGTFFEGERQRAFDLKPGKTFIVGARPHCFLALNDDMRLAYPALIDILGAENEHAIGGAREAPSPSDVIVAAVGGASILVASEPDCDQDRLARIIHSVSRFRERDIVELSPADIPTDRKLQSKLIKLRASRSTVVLDLGAHDQSIDPAFVSMLFKSRYQIRVIVLARSRNVIDDCLGQQYSARLQELWLRPLASRPEAIDRLFDRMLEEQKSPLRMSYLTPDNQDALRNYDWPKNFASLRQAAEWLTGIFQWGSIHKTAQTLNVAPSSMDYWYNRMLKFSAPLSRRLIRRDKAD
jgi:hypothetical protein